MKKLFIILYVLVHFTSVFAQLTPEDTLKKLFDAKKFEEIISVKDNFSEQEFSAEAFYCVAIAFLDGGKYEDAIKYFNKAIEKGPSEYKMFYYKGFSYKKQKKYNDAIEIFEKASSFDTTRSSALTEEAEILFDRNKIEDAESLLKKAISKEKVTGKAYYILSRIYDEKRHDEKKALTILYQGKEKVDKDDIYYSILHHLIAAYEQDNENYLKSNLMLFEILDNQNIDYSVIVMIIKNYFALGQIDSAKPYQNLLYKAHSENKLPEDMKEEYCFDRYKRNGKEVEGFESFYVPSVKKDFVFHKQTYYFYDKEGKLDFTIQTELFISLKGDEEIRYVLGMGKESDGIYYHQTYAFDYTEPVDYKKLKDDILTVLEGKVTPISSSKSKRN